MYIVLNRASLTIRPNLHLLRFAVHLLYDKFWTNPQQCILSLSLLLTFIVTIRLLVTVRWRQRQRMSSACHATQPSRRASVWPTYPWCAPSWFHCTVHRLAGCAPTQRTRTTFPVAADVELMTSLPPTDHPHAVCASHSLSNSEHDTWPPQLTEITLNN